MRSINNLKSLAHSSSNSSTDHLLIRPSPGAVLPDDFKGIFGGSLLAMTILVMDCEMTILSAVIKTVIYVDYENLCREHDYGQLISSYKAITSHHK